MQHTPWFTVFTGTYNRAQTLRCVYDALLAQTTQSFEWLIVDDGSTDDTEARVREMMGEDRLSVRYLKKANGGVHTAHNAAVREAKGTLFLRLDSDDTCVPNALEILLAKWLEIPEARRNQYSGVSCLCMRPSGQVIGDPYPTDVWDSTYNLLSTLRGEKWGFHRTAILREFPFPEFPGEKFVPEAVIWDRLQDAYRTRCINVPLRIFHATRGSLSKSISALRYSSGRGFLLYYSESLTRPQTVNRLVKLCANYTRTSFGLRRTWSQIVAGSPHKFWTLVTLPLGFALYLRDRARGLTEASS